MDNELIDLGRRAVVCKGWRWMPGVLDTAGSRVVEVTDNDWVTLAGGVEPGVYQLVGMGIPDLSDPATLGCMLALVREAQGLPALHVKRAKLKGSDWERWVVMSGRTRGEVFVLGLDGESVQGGTEAEALVAALEAAP